MKVILYSNQLLNYNAYGRESGNFLGNLGLLVSCPCTWDRTNTYNAINIMCAPLPDNYNNALTFDECCILRGDELWGQRKPITVFWSGGIDSTTTLVSLMLTQARGTDLTVLLTKESIDENPTFYNALLRSDMRRDGISLEFTDKDDIFDSNRYDGSRLLVTGECGDPVFGTFVVKNHIDELDDPWENIFNWEERRDNHKDDEFTSSFREFCREYSKLCPFEVKTIFDFTWWVSFAAKWQWIDRRMFAYLKPPTGWRNMKSFFNTEDFQKWSVVNHDMKHKGTWETYKWPAKEFIYKFHKDKNYLDHKTKESSLPSLVGEAEIRKKYQTVKLLMEDNTFFYTHEPIKNVDIWDIYNKKVFNPDLEISKLFMDKFQSEATN